MNSFLLIGGFIILLGIIFAISSMFNSPAKLRTKGPAMGASTQTNIAELSKSAVTQIPVDLRIVTKQKFNAIGWIGIVLLFICPLITGIVISNDINSFSRSMRYGYAPANYGLIYLALGFAGILAFIFVIIGREFYSVSSDQ
ncbi:hypothetical protein [Bartonella apihabitans]|uniref:hypothetical protein n=1 Tax=Bartonella apihabitans TaxID=2750929 RepID=UPI003BB4BEAA